MGAPGVDLGEFNSPWDIAVSAGRAFVADVYNNRVQALNALDGALLFQREGTGGNHGYLHSDGLVVGPDGRVYVTRFSTTSSFEIANA